MVSKQRKDFANKFFFSNSKAKVSRGTDYMNGHRNQNCLQGSLIRPKLKHNVIRGEINLLMFSCF